MPKGIRRSAAYLLFLLAGLTNAACLYGEAQTSHQPLAFEVASIKPVPPTDPMGLTVSMTGGPGTTDPGRFLARNASLYNLTIQAYDIKFYQLICPGWFFGARFNIDAKVPDRTTRSQFQLMLQTLLAERFKLQVHHDKKEMEVYDLVISKRGLKLKPSAKDTTSKQDSPPDPSKVEFGSDGYPVFLPGAPSTMIANGLNGRKGMRMLRESMDQFVVTLNRLVGHPIANRTGLTGMYDFTLRWVMQGAPASTDGPDIFEALEKEMGLKLQPSKGLVDVVVVDHADKIPTKN